MENSNKKMKIILISAVFAAIALGTMAFSLISKVSAADERINAKTSDGSIGRGGFPGNPAEDQKYLAEALGITEEELQDAQEQANEAAIQKAVELELITQEQADQMLSREKGFHGFRFGDRGKPGDAQTDGTVDYDALLAEALGITTAELKAARQEARDAMLADKVASGEITQEQVDLMEIRQALIDTIDPNALHAEALGITADQLQVYREEGKTMEDILSAAGMTNEEFQAALQSAYVSAIAQAVTDGVITQEQADLYLENQENGTPGFGFGPGRGGRGMPPAPNDPDQSASGTPVPGQGVPDRPMGGPGGGCPGGFGSPGGLGGPGGNDNPQPTPTTTS